MKQEIDTKVFDSRKQKQEFFDFLKDHVGDYIMETRESITSVCGVHFIPKKLYRVNEILSENSVILGAEIVVISEYPGDEEIRFIKQELVYPDYDIIFLEDHSIRAVLTVISEESYTKELSRLTKIILD